MTTKKQPEMTFEIARIDREVLHRAGIDLPADFSIEQTIKPMLQMLDENPVSLLWNNGKPKLSRIGGSDVIAVLYIKNNVVMGWSA